MKKYEPSGHNRIEGEESENKMKIKFFPTGQEVECDPAKSVLQMCNENNIEIRSLCKGVPSCAECRVRVKEGEAYTLPPTPKERHVLGSNYFLDGRRLSCQLHCFGPVTIDISEQLERTDGKNKKVRGFRKRGESQGEIHAKQDIMMLSETKK